MTQGETLHWLLKLTGFDPQTCYLFYDLTASGPLANQTLFLRYQPAAGIRRFELAQRCSERSVPITTEPETLFSAISITPGAGGLDSTDFIPEGLSFRRLRNGVPRLESLELVRALATQPVQQPIVAAKIWYKDNRYEGVLLAQHPRFPGLYTACYIALADTRHSQSYIDPGWANSQNSARMVFAVGRTVNIKTTSFKDPDALRNALLPQLSQIPNNPSSTVWSLGSMGLTYLKDDQAKAYFLQTPPASAGAPAKPIPLIKVEAFATKLEALTKNALATPGERTYAQPPTAGPVAAAEASQKLYDQLIELSALSASDAKAQLRVIKLIQQPILLLWP